ncbi:hypothetical protein [Endozoicomonas sp. SESOKO2]|uniref:hypothetical protein n=1 Tax=Endozoicomonas sp. SESOKO2 TaxID=2828743 RepID=UPI0021475984|nr:hypothetical protein [Endozoicomonas sp. SESOKO2]
MKYKILFITYFFLSGCSFGIIDHTHEIKHTKTIEQCYSIKKSSFLYEARCADLNSKAFGNSTFCTGIQAFDPMPYNGYDFKYPISWEEYIYQKEKWDLKLFNKLLFEKQRSMIAPIDIDTKIKIIGIYEYPRGETGHVLIVRAKIISGEFEGTEIELPSPGGFSDTGPSWSKQWFYKPDKNIKFSDEFMQECSDSSQ